MHRTRPSRKATFQSEAHVMTSSWPPLPCSSHPSARGQGQLFAKLEKLYSLTLIKSVTSMAIWPLQLSLAMPCFLIKMLVYKHHCFATTYIHSFMIIQIESKSFQLLRLTNSGHLLNDCRTLFSAIPRLDKTRPYINFLEK